VRRTVAVKLAGQTLNLRTEDDPESVQSIAAYLQERIDEIRRGVGENVSTHQVALLAGLQVVEELFRLRRDLGQLQGSTARRVRRVLSLLDEHEQSEVR
jgi:cell division protein ZapA (FtsZ GTPase activity inhibitor)